MHEAHHHALDLRLGLEGLERDPEQGNGIWPAWVDDEALRCASLVVGSLGGPLDANGVQHHSRAIVSTCGDDRIEHLGEVSHGVLRTGGREACDELEGPSPLAVSDLRWCEGPDPPEQEERVDGRGGGVPSAHRDHRLVRRHQAHQPLTVSGAVLGVEPEDVLRQVALHVAIDDDVESIQPRQDARALGEGRLGGARGGAR